MAAWLEACRGVYNYALRERKDWIKSRSCGANACSLQAEYIIAADAPYPDIKSACRVIIGIVASFLLHGSPTSDQRPSTR